MTGALTNHLWQSTLFAIAAGLLTLAFRNNRAKVRYWLWLSASLKFFIPFSLLIGIGNQLEWAPAAQKLATQVVGPAIPFTVEQISEPFSLGVAPARSTAGHIDWFFMGILAVWVCGFLAIASIRSRASLRIRDAVRASKPVTGTSFQYCGAGWHPARRLAIAALRVISRAPEGRLPIGRRLTICPTRPRSRPDPIDMFC
jgi:hypothetical protein